MIKLFSRARKVAFLSLNPSFVRAFHTIFPSRSQQMPCKLKPVFPIFTRFLISIHARHSEGFRHTSLINQYELLQISDCKNCSSFTLGNGLFPCRKTFTLSRLRDCRRTEGRAPPKLIAGLFRARRIHRRHGSPRLCSAG